MIGLVPNIIYALYNDNVDTALRVIKERVFFVKDNNQFVVPPQPASHLDFFERMSKFKAALDKTYEHCPIMTMDDFLSSYVGQQKEVYSKAARSLLIRPLEDNDAFISMFVKTEKVNFSDKPDSTPRGISPRSPRYHVSLGPTIKTIEKRIYKRIDKVFGSPTVFKGMNAHTRGKILFEKWNKFKNPVAIGMDASRFDQHVSKIALIWEHSFYKRYNKSKRFNKLLQHQLHNKCFYRGPDGDISYEVEGTRASGDMNTSLGNVLLMCGLINSYLSEVGVSKYELANDGDDCVLIVEIEQANILKKYIRSWFRGMGFTMKLEEDVTVFEKIEFCQSHPVWTSDGYVMTLSPKNGLAKQCLSINHIPNGNAMKRWLSTLGKGGMTLAGQIPIWQEFYQHCIKSSNGAKIIKGDPTMRTGFYMHTIKDMRREYGTIHPRTRYSFYLAFGISPAEQVIRERQIACEASTIFSDRVVQIEEVKHAGNII